MNLTVIVTCWKRFPRLADVLHAWLQDERVDELILWDNSEGHETPGAIFDLAANEVGPEDQYDGRLWVIRSSKNYGSSARYGLAALAKNEVLLFADDDVMPDDATILIDDLLEHYQPNRMVGIKGRQFNRRSYQGQDEVRGEKLAGAGRADPVLVDMLVGHIMLTHRKHLLGYNFADAAWYCCELELQGRIKMANQNMGLEPDAFELIVVPSCAHYDLPEQTDGNALYKHQDATPEKEGVFSTYFRDQPHLVRFRQ
jgi:hypothetical protein